MNGAGFFDEAASGYDPGCLRALPDPEGFYGAVVENLPFGRDEELRVLDIGAGTGLLSVVVARRFPEAKITLVDFSAEMLEVARRRCAGASGRFEFRVLDYAREPLPGGDQDLVVSALSTHHLAHDDKRKTFGKVFDALTDGGRFVNADYVSAEPERGRPAHPARHAPAHHAPGSRHPEGSLAPNVETATLQMQMAWLRDAGFEEVKCHYEENGLAVYGGQKVGERER